VKIFLRNTGFIVLLTFLSVAYIFNSHCAVRKLRKIVQLEKRVEEAKFEFQAVKSDINFKCTESQLAKRLEPEGLIKNEESLILIDS